MAHDKSSFQQVVQNDGAEDRWYDFSGGMRQRPYIRQQVVGTTLRWETAPLPSVLQAVESFVFMGGIGWESEPRTDGFELVIESASPVRFDVTRAAGKWTNTDDSVRLHYFPTWTSDVDSAGFFYLQVDRRWLAPDRPLNITLRSLGAGSQRWFALDPIPNAKSIEELVARLSKLMTR